MYAKASSGRRDVHVHHGHLSRNAQHPDVSGEHWGQTSLDHSGCAAHSKRWCVRDVYVADEPHGGQRNGRCTGGVDTSAVCAKPFGDVGVRLGVHHSGKACADNRRHTQLCLRRYDYHQKRWAGKGTNVKRGAWPHQSQAKTKLKNVCLCAENAGGSVFRKWIT